MDILGWGALCFGVVIGWVTYRTLRRKNEATVLADISAVIAALGSAAVIAFFKDAKLFAAYCIGLLVGFVLYFVISLILYGKEGLADSMGR